MTQKEFRKEYEAFRSITQKLRREFYKLGCFEDIDIVFYYISCNPRLIKVFEKFIKEYEDTKHDKRIKNPIPQALYKTWSYFDYKEKAKKSKQNKSFVQ